jgi:hypothetical protein
MLEKREITRSFAVYYEIRTDHLHASCLPGGLLTLAITSLTHRSFLIHCLLRLSVAERDYTGLGFGLENKLYFT